MKKILLLALSILLICTGCTTESKTLNVYNWGDYIDTSILKDFENETGIKVNYEMYASNEDLYIKVKKSGEAYDVIFPSDYMISKMISEDLLYEYDVTELENYKNIKDEFRGLDFDKNNRYSVPYFWGTMGLIYNKNYVDEKDVESWDCLFNDKYKDNILLYDAQRDVLGIGFKKLGYSLNSKNPNELKEAKELMARQKKFTRAYVTDNMKTFLLSGEGVIGYTDSGAAFQVIYEGGEENFGYKIPKEGSNLWVDSMVIPKNSRHKEEAKKFIDFISRADVAQKNLEYVQYSSPNKETGNPLEEDEAELWNEFQPNITEIKNCEVYLDLGDYTKYFNDAWVYLKCK